MLGLGATTRVFVATGGTDMRLGFNGLYALVVGQLKEDPQSGHLFLFANKRRDSVQLTREEFALLIGGIDLRTATKRKWYRRGVAEQVNSSQKVA